MASNSTTTDDREDLNDEENSSLSPTTSITLNELPMNLSPGSPQLLQSSNNNENEEVRWTNLNSTGSPSSSTNENNDIPFSYNDNSDSGHCSNLTFDKLDKCVPDKILTEFQSVYGDGDYSSSSRNKNSRTKEQESLIYSPPSSKVHYTLDVGRQEFIPNTQSQSRYRVGGTSYSNGDDSIIGNNNGAGIVSSSDLLMIVEENEQDLQSSFDSDEDNNSTHQHHNRYHPPRSQELLTQKMLSDSPSSFDYSEERPSTSTCNNQLHNEEYSYENETYAFYEEGYESDLPMVRASMRKLKPVTLMPRPTTSTTSPNHNNNNHHTNHTNPICSTIGSGSGLAQGSSLLINTNHHHHHQIHNNSSNPNDASFISNSTRDSEVQVPGGSEQMQNRLLLNFGNHSRTNSYSGGPNTISSATLTATTTPIASLSSSLCTETRSQCCGSTSSNNNSGTNCCPDGFNSPAYRPSSDLIFQNLHVSPIDVSEVMRRIEQSENDTNNLDQDEENAINNNNNNNSSVGTGSGSNSSNINGRNRRRRRGRGGIEPVDDGDCSLNGQWPHRLSSVLALVGCTLGLNNICRFGLLGVQYGANFILQFLFLSIIFGIPLLMFHMSMGQYMSSGVVDMWKVSPIFQGIGIALVITQAMIGVYTAVGVSWMFIYFRDSFIPRYDQYRWGKCFRDYRACDHYFNNVTELAETVPDYFNGVVLQRSSPEYPSGAYIPSTLKFTVAFNLAVVWMLIFVSLSKGLKSYGKVVHGFVLIPITSILVLSSKMIGLIPSEEVGSLFGLTSWESFFLNSQTWLIAGREAFFTWGVLGACAMQITSHNRLSHSLKSDASIIVLITCFVFLLTTFLGNVCYTVLQSHGYDYIPSSFESEQTYKFLIRKPVPIFPDIYNYSNNYSTSEYYGPPPLFASQYGNKYTSFLMGIRITKPNNPYNGQPMTPNSNNLNTVSGYQALRLATELFPSTMALLGSQGMSPFWTVLFYFTFILFGIAQQLTIWYCVIKGVIAIKLKILKEWETTLTFCICSLGFVFGLPLCTEFGIFVVYFLDYIIGNGWWIMVLYLLELLAIFIIRGGPYCGENIASVLLPGTGRVSAFLTPLLSILWNVAIPGALLLLAIASFKSGNVRELYDWNPSHGYVFWPSWTRELGSLIQLLPILVVPIAAIIQSYRYLSKGPPDLFDRLHLLYRPHSSSLRINTLSAHLGRTNSTVNFPSRDGTPAPGNDDPPPKYTPPPSYSTATGAKIAKFLRSSLRRSLRRLSGVPGTSSAGQSNLPPPPTYSFVQLEINPEPLQIQPQHFDFQLDDYPFENNESSSSPAHSVVPIIISPPPPEDESQMYSLVNEREGHIKFEVNVNGSKINLSNENSASGSGESSKQNVKRMTSDITPIEVARLLRTNFRRDHSLPPDGTELFNGRRRGSLEYDNGLRSATDYYRTRTCSIPRNHNSDFGKRIKSRRNNDSQLSLLTHENSTETLNQYGLSPRHKLDGLVNPNFSLNPNSQGDYEEDDEDQGSSSSHGYYRSRSGTVPSNFHSNLKYRRHLTFD